MSMNKTWAISSWISFLISRDMPTQLRPSPWRTPTSFFRRERSGSPLKRGPVCRVLLADNLQSRLAPTINQLLQKFGRPPLLHFLAYGGGEVGPQLEQILKCFGGRTKFSELPGGGGDRGGRKPVPWHIEFVREIECAAEVALAVGVVEVGNPIPSRMMGIELLGASCQRQATVPIASPG